MSLVSTSYCTRYYYHSSTVPRYNTAKCSIPSIMQCAVQAVFTHLLEPRLIVLSYRFIIKFCSCEYGREIDCAYIPFTHNVPGGAPWAAPRAWWSHITLAPAITVPSCAPSNPTLLFREHDAGAGAGTQGATPAGQCMLLYPYTSVTCCPHSAHRPGNARVHR